MATASMHPATLKLLMMAAEWHVRPVIDSDYEQWRELYHSYREFYKQERSEDVVNTVWSWIRDPNHVTQALVTVTSSDDIGGNNKIILGGLAHHRRWPNPLRGKMNLYLDDLFTLPELRGKGIATLLINTLSEMAKKEGLSALRWTTDKDNTTARRLYDSLGTATSKVTYVLGVCRGGLQFLCSRCGGSCFLILEGAAMVRGILGPRQRRGRGWPRVRGPNREPLTPVSCNVATGGRSAGHSTSHATSTCVDLKFVVAIPGGLDSNVSRIISSFLDRDIVTEQGYGGLRSVYCEFIQKEIDALLKSLGLKREDVVLRYPDIVVCPRW